MYTTEGFVLSVTSVSTGSTAADFSGHRSRCPDYVRTQTGHTSLRSISMRAVENKLQSIVTMLPDTPEGPEGTQDTRQTNMLLAPPTPSSTVHSASSPAQAGRTSLVTRCVFVNGVTVP